MKFTVTRPVEIEVTFISVHLPVRYEEEDIPNDFPLRKGDIWSAVIEIDTGKIRDWPEGKSGNLHLKVCDSGQYTVGNEEDASLAVIEDYVPHGVIPGKYGDYVDLKINEHGIITNWPKKPDVSAFFGDSDED